MKKFSLWFLLAGGLFLLAGCATTQPETAAAPATTADSGHRHHGMAAPGHQHGQGMMMPQDQEERRDVLYTCACGPGCDCNTVSVKPGVCRCGQPLKWGHILKVEGNEALVCQCHENCRCTLDAEDPSKCGCGKPVKRVNLEGSGLYFCNCGGSCFCNTVSDQPGQCRCGMQLKKVD